MPAHLCSCCSVHHDTKKAMPDALKQANVSLQQHADCLYASINFAKSVVEDVATMLGLACRVPWTPPPTC